MSDTRAATLSASRPTNHVSRRSLAGGAVWSIPVLAWSSSAPAIAASLGQAGLAGYVSLGKSCTRTTLTVAWNGLGSFTDGSSGDRGVWVYSSNATVAPTNAYMVMYAPSAYPMTWTTAAGNSGWSVPVSTTNVAIAPAIAGYTAYVTYYTGTWTYNTTYSVWIADGDMNFTGTASASRCPAVSLYVYRSVNYNGQTVSITRGPVTI